MNGLINKRKTQALSDGLSLPHRKEQIHLNETSLEYFISIWRVFQRRGSRIAEDLFPRFCQSARNLLIIKKNITRVDDIITGDAVHEFII